MVKRKGMKYAEHLARLEVMRNVHTVLGGKLKERDYFGDQDLAGRIVSLLK
jgi:hypothetical protein